MGLIEFATAIYQGCKFDLLAEIIEEGAEWVKERVKTFVTNIRINERYTALLPRLDGLLADKTFADALAKDITTAIGKNTKGAGLSSSLFQKFLLQRSATFETYVGCFPSCQTLNIFDRASVVAFLTALNEEVITYHKTHTLTAEHQTLVAVIADTLEKRLGTKGSDTLATLSSHLFPLPEVCPVCGSLHISHGNGEGICEKGHRFPLKMDEKVAALIRDVESSRGSTATLTSLSTHIASLEGIASRLEGDVDRFDSQLDRLEGMLSGSKRKREKLKPKKDAEPIIAEPVPPSASKPSKAEDKVEDKETKCNPPITNPDAVVWKLIFVGIFIAVVVLASIIFSDSFFGTPGLVYEPLDSSEGIGYAVVDYEGDAASVKIPKYHNFRRVTVIKSGAFSGCDFITDVKINNVKEIHPFAFNSCDNLESVYVPAFSTWSVEGRDGTFYPHGRGSSIQGQYLTGLYVGCLWTRN